MDGWIYLLNTIGLTPGGSSTVHIYTETIHRTTQLNTELHTACLSKETDRRMQQTA